MKTITGSLTPGKNGMLHPVFTCACKQVMEDYPMARDISVVCPKCQTAKNFRITEFAPRQWSIKPIG